MIGILQRFQRNFELSGTSELTVFELTVPGPVYWFDCEYLGKEIGNKHPDRWKDSKDNNNRLSSQMGRETNHA